MPKKDQQERERQGERWKRFRKKNLLTQRELARLLGICEAEVSRIENGHVSPRRSTVAKFERPELMLELEKRNLELESQLESRLKQLDSEFNSQLELRLQKLEEETAAEVEGILLRMRKISEEKL